MPVIQCQGLVAGDVNRVNESLLHLYQAYNAVVDESYEFRPYAFAHHRLLLYLKATYSLGLDEQLVGERRWPQYSPRGTVVVQLLRKQVATFSHYGFKFLVCIHFGCKVTYLYSNDQKTRPILFVFYEYT